MREVAWDLEGRVSVVELKPGVGKPLALINVYAVNGTDAAYRDPRTGRVVGTRHERKREFHSLLKDECLRLEEMGFEVVVAGDLNVARERVDGWPRLRERPEVHCVNRADFNEKFFGEGEESWDAVDVWREGRGEERGYTYFPRGREWGSSCDRVDMVLTSRTAWKRGRVRGTGILDSPQERGPSDHVPIWVEIE